MRAIDRLAQILDAVFPAAVCVLLCSGAASDLLVSLAIHEAAHLIALHAAGGRPASFSTIGFGFRLRYACAMLSRPSRLAVAVSGAAANLLFTLIFAPLGLFRFASVNLVLAIFNLLPISGLDGAEALDVIFSGDGTYSRGRFFCRAVSTVTAAALWLFSIVLQFCVAPMPETVVVSSALLVRELLA